MLSIIFAVVAALMLIFFVYAAGVNVNDPDPVRWVSIYGLCAVFSGFAIFHHFHWVTIPAALAYATGTYYWMPKQPLQDKKLFFSDWSMVNMGVEEWRETGGLLICAVWCAILGIMWALH